MIPKFSINAILDALASQQQHGETSLIVTIEPDLIQDAMHALRAYRKSHNVKLTQNARGAERRFLNL